MTKLPMAVEARTDELTPEQRDVLLARRPSGEGELRQAVAELLREVARDGDRALVRMARDFDGVELEALEVPRARWDQALDSLDPQLRADLERAARNIEVFHRAQIPGEVRVEVEPGLVLGRRTTPLPAVGVYAPGGRAAYPSSVLMGVVPARAAGVPQIVVCSPPGPDGLPPEAVMAACALGGATRLFALGGAGAVAALARGTESVPRVEAIVGPGNQWVTEAKRQVAGELRIDSPAGPSEVLVVAGPGADPARVAAELVAQAEHDPEAAVAAVSWSTPLLAAVRTELARQVADSPRREIVETALERRGGLLEAPDRAAALAFAEDYAAEHLALYTDDPRADLDTQTTAGTVFVGEDATVAFGDYLTGANHVLPTSGRSRSFSGLSVLEFLRFHTWQELTPAAARSLAGPTGRLADLEGLPGHARAARMRGNEAGLRPGAPLDPQAPGETSP
ncbi:MAG: histidinol dehydrogenase [Gemmatimonadales bacterium]|nr:MAG: histidinol dehydrogenase [Gemmatimonadales bacterium]